MFKRFISISIIVIMLVSMGLGCKGLSQEEQALVRPVTLEYWTVFDNVQMLRQFAQEYQQVRPYVTINIRQIRQAEFDNLFTNALADDIGPDIISVHNQQIRQYQSRLLPAPASVQVARVTVEGTLQKQTVITPETYALPTVSTIAGQYVTAVAQDVIVDNAIYGLPLSFDSMAIYYNKELLDKSGTALPPTTWEEFSNAVKAAVKISQNGDLLQSGVAMGTGNNIDNAFDIVSLLMMQNGVTMEQGGRVILGEQVNRQVNAEPALESLRYYTDFARPTRDFYTWNEQMGNSFNEFARGQTLFYFGYAYDMARIKTQAPQLKLGVIPVPQLDPNAPVSIANYWVQSVVRKTDHANEAWDFVRYMSTPENIARYANATGLPSPLRSGVAAAQNDPEMGPFVAQALIARNWYHGNDIEAARQAFEDMITDYLQPLADRESQAERDRTVITRTIQKVQQTY